MSEEQNDNSPGNEPEESKPMQTEDVDSGQPETKRRKGCGCWWALLIAVIVLGVAWFLVRPGVFTVQPIGALPEGITLVYHSRGPEMAFFSSPDSLCLEMQGSVSLVCRVIALGSVEELADRIILRVPYMEWAYLASTGGSMFDR